MTTRTGDDDIMRYVNAGTRLGTTDARGVLVPDTLPVTVNVAPWPSEPGSLDITEDGREHILSVTRPCSVTLTWDDPGDPAIREIALGDFDCAPIGDGAANLTVPCGVHWIRTNTSETPRVEPVPDHFDSTDGSVHLTWRGRDSIRVCVTDEEGERLPDAVVEQAWPDGGCWRYPDEFCARARAPGFLGAELCPELGLWGGFLRSNYHLALERGVRVDLRCDEGLGPTACPEKMGVLQCRSEVTPDVGVCFRGPDWGCTCPDAPDARVVAQAGPFSGESASVREGEATFTHTGTASLTVPGADFCGAMLLRDDGDLSFVIGRLRCVDGQDAQAKHLVGGTYHVVAGLDGGTGRWADIRIASGEAKVAALRVPDGHAVEVRWAGGPVTDVFSVVHAKSYEAQFFSAPTEAPALVPPGATLWVCSEDGCCRYEDPGATVSCSPSGLVMPPIPDGPAL